MLLNVLLAVKRQDYDRPTFEPSCRKSGLSLWWREHW